jgi:serine/threonine-protein kinase RsbW
VDRADTGSVEFRFPGTLAGFETAFGQLRDALDRDHLDPAVRHDVELVFEEIVANIVRHGAPDGGSVDVRVVLELADQSIVLTFDDDGVPFDPRGRDDPAPAKSLAEARIGGLGLMLVRRASSGMDYRRTADQRNLLVIKVPEATRGIRAGGSHG